MQPEKWRNLRIKQHIAALVQQYPSYMYTSDEMALNLIFKGRITELKQCYNVFSSTESYLTEKPRIWHFNTQKPILHMPIDKFPRWFENFSDYDKKVLRKLDDLFHRYGLRYVLSINSDEYFAL